MEGSQAGILLLVILGSVGVMGLVLSYIRYRTLELQAKEEMDSEEGVSAAAWVLNVIPLIRKGGVLLCHTVPAEGEGGKALLDLLQYHTRTGDVHHRLVDGSVVSVFACPSDHGEALAARLKGLMESQNLSPGVLRIWEPEIHPERLFAWVDQSIPLSKASEWGTEVDVRTEELEEATGANPAVDEETGVYRAEWMARVTRRKLAECRRLSRTAIILRVAAGEDAQSRMKELADELMAACREEDLIGRSGEAELVLCMEAELSQGETLAGRIAAQLAGKGLNSTIGLAAMPEHGGNPNTLYERAGIALLHAAENDGYPVRMFEETMEQMEHPEEQVSFDEENF